MRLLDVAIDEDLAPFSRHLWVRRIAHRVYEESGRQILELTRSDDAQAARSDYEAWRSGALTLVHPDELPEPVATRPSLLRLCPVIVTVLALAAVSYLVTAGGRLDQGLAAQLTFVDLRRVGDGLGQLFARMELWRLFTPMFLHFHVAHLLFNCAVVWEVGRRVETLEGSLRSILLLLLLSFASNLAQFWFSGMANFGGLSGVAYGLVGFVLVRARLTPKEPLWQLPSGVAVGLLVFLVLFSTGIADAWVRIANAAHWGGFVSGLLLGWVFAQFPAHQRPPELEQQNR